VFLLAYHIVNTSDNKGVHQQVSTLEAEISELRELLGQKTNLVNSLETRLNACQSDLFKAEERVCPRSHEYFVHSSVPANGHCYNNNVVKATEATKLSDLGNEFHCLFLCISLFLKQGNSIRAARDLAWKLLVGSCLCTEENILGVLTRKQPPTTPISLWEATLTVLQLVLRLSVSISAGQRAG
jgi:hypothetical protein